jgi:cytidyltransferase-like protein
MGGSFNPIHTGHIETMNAARKKAEQQGFEVLAGFLAVANDKWVNKTKPLGHAIPAQHRINMCREAVKNNQWIKEPSVPYVSAKRLLEDVINDYSKKERVAMFIVSGEDKYRRNNYKHKIQSICVSRSLDSNNQDLLQAVKPGLSSSLICEYLIKTKPTIKCLKELVRKRQLSIHVGKYIVANISALKTRVPLLFE